MQKWILHHSLRLVHGPGEEVPYGMDEVIVLAVLRDGRAYVKSFVEHYRSLGAKHLVFLDNGSTCGAAPSCAAPTTPSLYHLAGLAGSPAARASGHT